MLANDLFSCFDFENRTYYYHITAKEAGDLINEEGLAMADSHIWSTMIEIKPELIEDIDFFLANEHDMGLRKTEIMVIIATNKGDEEYLVIKNKNGKSFSWNEESADDYYVSEKNILGYIDLTDESYPFVANPNCYADELENMLYL